MMTSLVLTVLGEDRPGLVESLAQVIAAHGGNWLESRMARLAGKFAGILRAAVPQAHTDALTSALRDLESQGLRLLIDWSPSDVPVQDARQLRLNLVGNDHAGIMRDVAHALAWRGINIDELHTETTHAPMSGEALFRAVAYVRVPRDVALAALQGQLEHIAHDLMVDITLEDVSSPATSPLPLP